MRNLLKRHALSTERRGGLVEGYGGIRRLDAFRVEARCAFPTKWGPPPT